jgi:hypothetical protein
MPKPLVDLDKASLDCMREIAKLAGVRRGQPGLLMRNTIQITIREAMRAALPPKDPRKDPNFSPNQKS